MKASPMQKYALRLLLASNKLQASDAADWQRIKSESAESTLSRFGGTYQAIRETELPEKHMSERPVAEAESPAPTPAREFNIQPHKKDRSCPSGRTF